MSDNEKIPVLTDLIESGPEITLSDLGLDDEPQVEANRPAFDETGGDMAIHLDEAAPVETDRADISPVLEHTVRRILDEHMELAWQEIRIAIKQYLDRS